MISLEKSSIKLKKWKKVDREKLVYKTDKHTFDFRKFNTVKTFGKDIYDGKITLKKADESQSDLLNEIKTFNERTRPKIFWSTKMKEIALDKLNKFYEAREMVLNGFKSGIFLAKSTGTGLFNTDNSKFKILTPKQLLQRLPIALTQVQEGNNSENLLNEIRQIIYSLYQYKEITKKVYNNLMKSL